MNVRVVRNRQTQNSLKMFFKTVRGFITHIRNIRASGKVSTNGTVKGTWVTVSDGYLFLRLGSIGKYGSTAAQRNQRNIARYIQIIRWFADNDVCICEGRDRCSEPNHERCAEERNKLKGTEGQGMASYVVKSLFEEVNGIGGTNSGQGTSGDVSTDVVEDTLGDENDTVGCSEDDDMGPDDAWVRCKHRNYDAIEEQLDAVLEVCSFSLLDPVSLGFFPFHSECCEGNRTERPSNNEESAPAERLTVAAVAPSLSGSITVQKMSTKISESSSDGEVRDMVKQLAMESTKLNKTLAARLKELSSCVHGGRNIAQWVCSECADLEAINVKAVQVQNSVLGRFVHEVIANGSSANQFTRAVAGVKGTVTEARAEEFEKYLRNLSAKMHRSSIQYWKKYGSVGLNSIDDHGD